MNKVPQEYKIALVIFITLLLALTSLRLTRDSGYLEGYRKGAFETMTACKLGVINCNPEKKDLRT